MCTSHSASTFSWIPSVFWSPVCWFNMGQWKQWFLIILGVRRRQAVHWVRGVINITVSSCRLDLHSASGPWADPWRRVGGGGRGDGKGAWARLYRVVRGSLSWCFSGGSDSIAKPWHPATLHDSSSLSALGAFTILLQTFSCAASCPGTTTTSSREPWPCGVQCSRGPRLLSQFIQRV